jgi:hypothetical protein
MAQGVHDTHAAETGLFQRSAAGENRGENWILLHQETRYAYYLIENKGGSLAERVGFVPDEPAILNGLGQIGTARNRQIL